MSVIPRLTVIGVLALAACSQGQPEPQPGTVERFTNQIERSDADEKRRAIEAADGRAERRADDATKRIAESERERQRDEPR